MDPLGTDSSETKKGGWLCLLVSRALWVLVFGCTMLDWVYLGLMQQGKYVVSLYQVIPTPIYLSSACSNWQQLSKVLDEDQFQCCYFRSFYLVMLCKATQTFYEQTMQSVTDGWLRFVFQHGQGRFGFPRLKIIGNGLWLSRSSILCAEGLRWCKRPRPEMLEKCCQPE